MTFSNEDLLVRPVTVKDMTQLTPMMMAYIADFTNRQNLLEQAVTEHISYILAHPEAGIQFAAEHRGECLGFATLYFSFSTLRLQKIAILNDLFVQEESRGKKVGERLFEHCLDYSKVNSYAWMQWETTRDNFAARKLYEKMGGRISELLVYEIEC